MTRSIAPFALCFVLALLVSAPVSVGADKPPKELWDQYPLDATPTPGAEAPQPTPAPSAQPQPQPAPAATEDDGGGIATPALLALLVGAAGLGGAAVFTAGRRMRSTSEEPARAEPAARSWRFARGGGDDAAPVAAANGHARADEAATPAPKPHPVSREKAARRAKRAKPAADAPRPRRAAADEPSAEKPRTRRRAAADEPTAEKPRTRRRAADEPTAEPAEATPSNGAVPHDELPGDAPVETPDQQPVADEATASDRADEVRETPAADEPAADAETPAQEPERGESWASRRRRGAWKRAPDEPPARRAAARERPDEIAAERIAPPQPQRFPPPAEPVADADADVFPACRIKLHNRPIRTHFYAVPYEGGPVLARSPYFKLQRGDDDPGPTAPDALRALVDELHALGWQQTGVGSAPWDLRFQRGVRVAQRRG